MTISKQIGDKPPERIYPLDSIDIRLLGKTAAEVWDATLNVSADENTVTVRVRNPNGGSMYVSEGKINDLPSQLGVTKVEVTRFLQKPQEVKFVWTENLPPGFKKGKER